ncbi:far upstream element-binding protein 2-like, partial [Geospiza fortis]|uniref:Far upstream element-binding protein 2-like n=1 Tax=Geospiza fortis TaxID=48883 RepID=A0A8N5I5G8_GEOFO
MIPAGKAGLVIGKGGETIKQLQERAGVKMILIQDGSQNTNVDKPLRIIGEPYKVQQACEMVLDILRERDQGGFGDRSDYGARLGGGIDVSESPKITPKISFFTSKIGPKITPKISFFTPKI